VRLTVVGCSGSHPGPASACSCYLVEHDGFRLLLDIGNGALGELQRHVDPRDVDALFISHLHGDHWLDLVPLSHARRHHPDARVPPPLRVVVPSERSRISGVFGQPESALADAFVFESPADGRVGPFDVRVTLTAHPIEAHAVRISAGGATLVYTADTGPFPDLAAFARRADLLLAEAGFVDGAANPPGVHLTAGEAGDLARTAGVDRLVVTHVPPWYDAEDQKSLAAQAFGGQTMLAQPGLTVEI
jgi:ribonuclease BN (tRNA processing enzyme)